jgi:probable HAF family extracellular repeat protein
MYKVRALSLGLSRLRPLQRFGLVIVSGLAAATLLVGAAGAGARAYTITDLGTLAGTSSFGSDINNRGQVVGSSSTASGSFDAALWQDGLVTDLGILEGDTTSAALGINDRGQVVGYGSFIGFPEPGPTHAILWDQGEITSIGVLGGVLDSSLATAINNRGQVVGFSANQRLFPGAPVYQHAFLWQDGVMTDLGTLGGDAIVEGDVSAASALNEHGQIVGLSSTASGDTHAVLWQNGAVTDLGTLGGNSSSASDINNRGQIVGTSTTASGESHAFLWQNGLMTDLGMLGGCAPITPFSEAASVNDRGQVVGQTTTPSCEAHAFLWQNGVMTDLGTLAGPYSAASAVNKRGQIAGGSTTDTTSGDIHAALWQPSQ